MGLWSERTDEISGAESVSLYHNYIAKRKTTTLKKILLHNSDDISLLQRLLKILDRCDVHKAMHEIGFPLIYKKNSGLVPRMITTDNIKIIPACVEVSGKQYYNGTWTGQPAGPPLRVAVWGEYDVSRALCERARYAPEPGRVISML